MVFSSRILSSIFIYLISFGEQPKCRCLYGESCWPSETPFNALSSRISQPLLQPLPPASPCYTLSSFDNYSCSIVADHYHDPNWRADKPGAMQNPNFETFIHTNGTVDACYLNVNLELPCKQGSIPPVGIDARTAEDVQAAVLFASTHNLRLVVKNTGHDYLGRSAGHGGFLVWTHYMKQKVYHPHFIPMGTPPGLNKTFNAVTFGAGVQWSEAYDFVHRQGKFIVGGITPGGSVGAAGGWILGGGHSAFSPVLGLGVDNVLQFTVVLADGSHITANSYQYPDLYWALRGGGGGTFGIVTSVTYHTHPTFPVSTVLIRANFTTPNIALDVVTEFVKLHPKFSDAGWGGYSGFINATMQMFFVSPNKTGADVDAMFGELVEYTKNATSGMTVSLSQSYPDVMVWYRAFFEGGTAQVGVQVEIASRLLSRRLVEDDPRFIARIMLEAESGVGVNSVAGGVVSRVDQSSAGLNPSWRKVLAEVYIGEVWTEGSSVDVILRARKRLKKNTDVIDNLSTDSGSYLNEGSLYERDFKKSFFGSHYDKLKEIKNRYDPTSLFVVASGVGSDEWDETLRCRI